MCSLGAGIPRTACGLPRRWQARSATIKPEDCQVLVGGSDLLDADELSVPRTAIAHPGGVGFRRLAPTEGERASPIRRPGAVIVTDDGLGLAVAESDLVDGHSASPADGRP